MSFFHGSSAALARFESEKQDTVERYPCTIMQWIEETPGRHTLHSYTTETASQLRQMKNYPLTVIVAPLDEDEGDRLAGFRALVERYDIPGTFINESNQHVLNSFGYVEKSEKCTCTWLHFLLKEVEQMHETMGKDMGGSPPSISRRIGRFFKHLLKSKPPQNPSQDTDQPILRIPLRQLDGKQEARATNWSRCAFFLSAEKKPPEPRNSESESLSSRTTGWDAQEDATCGQISVHNITLICFGAPLHVVDEMERLSDTLSIAGVLDHPYVLWELILYHLSMFLDVEMWNVIEAFGTEQRDLGYLTARPSKSLSDIDFSGLHLLADHMILVLEGARGLLASVDGLIHHLETDVGVGGPSHLARRTRQALQYRRRFILSTTERGITFEKRINNMISLFFNHVSLQDSGLVMRDSSSLRSVALMTLFFLPVTSVATVFGSEFFYQSEKDDGSRSIHMDPAGWTMFLVSGLVTMALVAAWNWQVKRLEKRFTRGAAHPRQVKDIKFSA